MKKTRIHLIKWRLLALFWVFILILLDGPYAFSEDEKWRVGFLTGIYDPSLETLNKVIANSNQAFLQDPNFLLPRSLDFPANKRNISSNAIEADLNFGLEIERMVSERHSILLTLSVWNGESVARDEIPFFLRADQQDPFFFPREARYNVQLNQFWLSWRYYALNDPEVGRVFFNVGLAGFALANFTLDALVKAVCPDSDPNCVAGGGFALVSSTEASGFGFTTHFGLGGEYYLTDWLSIGANINYILGEVDNLEVDRVFLSGFEQFGEVPPESLFGTIGIPTPPTLPVVGENLTFADVNVDPALNNLEEIGQRFPSTLELGGLSTVLLIRIHF